MFFYEIGYTTWDESPITILSHIKKFTKDEFNEFVLQAYVKANIIAKKQHNEWFDEWLENKIQNDEELDDDYIDDMRYSPTVSDLNRNVIDILIKEFGFKRLNIQVEFIPSDGSIPIGNTTKEPTDYNSSCDLLNLIKDRILIIEERDKKINKVLK